MAGVCWSGRHGAEIHGINRKGLLIGLPETVFGSVRSIPGNFILDGECVGDLFCAFDLLEQDGQDLAAESYQRRLVKLMGFSQSVRTSAISVWSKPPSARRARSGLFQRLQTEKREGVVFKRLDAPYTPGRPNSGGHPTQAQVLRHLLCGGLQDQRQAERRTAAAQRQGLESGRQRHHPGQLPGA